MRILSVRLPYLYSHNEDTIEQTIEKRRNRLSNLGFDTSQLDNDELRSGVSLGMTDEQFVNLSIEGEAEMKITASVMVD